MAPLFYGSAYFLLLRLLVCALLLIAFVKPVDAAVNYNTCLTDIQQGYYGLEGGTDNRGHPIYPISNTTTAITYELCIRACGKGANAFSWSVFSQQMSSWLLPWLALLPQLPYGGRITSHNVQSILLAVGSPTLAAYSLALTVLNGRWAVRRFAKIAYPNRKEAVSILNNLHQAPLRLTDDHSLLSSLVVLPENDQWWKSLSERLDYTQTWSIAAAVSIAWVIIAYAFTVADSFGDPSTLDVDTVTNGQGVGSVWLWLLPVVVGWLQLSPKCDFDRLERSFSVENDRVHVVGRDGVVQASERPVSLESDRRDSVHSDVDKTPPIFNYARSLSWSQSAEVMATAFQAAHRHMAYRSPSDESIPHVSHRGSVQQMKALGDLREHASCNRSRWAPGVFSRMLIASFAALFLQWCTTGAAFLMLWLTPTMGLGCRSGSYLLYGVLSTFAWILILVSTVLAHYSETHRTLASVELGVIEVTVELLDRSPGTEKHPSQPFPPSPTSPRDSRITGLFAVLLRRTGKLVAFANSIWLILSCSLQFSHFFSRCWCDSSVAGLGAKAAYNVITLLPDDFVLMKKASIAGLVLGSGSALVYAVFINLCMRQA